MSHFVQWWCKASINKTFNYMFYYTIHARNWVNGKIPVNPSVSIKLDSKTGLLTTVCLGFFQRCVIGLVCIIDIGLSFRHLSRFHCLSPCTQPLYTFHTICILVLCTCTLYIVLVVYLCGVALLMQCYNLSSSVSFVILTGMMSLKAGLYTLTSIQWVTLIQHVCV